MKKIINGKHYDTTNATIIGQHQIGRPDRRVYLKEGLYHTPRSKDFFLAGESGPYGPYAKYLGDNTYGYGEGVRPLTVPQAVEWAKHYLGKDI